MLKEQKDVLGEKDTNVPLDFDSVGKMEYLQNSVKESLRMFPPLIMLMRMAMQDIETTLNGKKYTIPKGDIVITSPAVASRMASVFTKPDEFDPNRFNGPEVKVPYAYLGFGGGMHGPAVRPITGQNHCVHLTPQLHNRSSRQGAP
jgi:sterol 14alpha-demethylase